MEPILAEERKHEGSMFEEGIGVWVSSLTQSVQSSR